MNRRRPSPTTAIPRPLPSLATADADVNGAGQQSAVDELWWEEGGAVQSLEIACRLVSYVQDWKNVERSTAVAT